MKHEWIKKGNGEVDDFAASSGFCNGPMCRLCGFSFCQHCEPEGYEDENCPGYPTAENIELYLGNKKRYYAFIVEDNGKERVDADWVEISYSP